MSTVEQGLRVVASPSGSSAAKSRMIAAVVTLTLAAVSTPSAWAQVFKDSTSIGASSLTNSVGSISVNQVAGVGNQQSNTSLITDVPGHLSVNQASSGNFISSQNRGSTNIGDNALAGSTGLIQVSQTSGTGNVAANAAFVGVANAADALNAISLSQMRGGFAPADPNSMLFDGQNTISPTAFAGASGVIQVQQTAGNDNLVANSLAVHVGGAIPH